VATYRSQQPVSDIYICKLVIVWFFWKSNAALRRDHTRPSIRQSVRLLVLSVTEC